MKIIGICSGYFNPLTKAHLQCFEEAAVICDELYVIVNNDIQVELKGSIPFQDVIERTRIVNALKPVTKAFEAQDGSLTVEKTIYYIVANYTKHDDILLFINGGDRVAPSEKELEVCKEYEIRTIYGVGGYEKTQSSSKLIEKAAQKYYEKQQLSNLACPLCDGAG